jgi:hypothetical protein
MEFKSHCCCVSSLNFFFRGKLTQLVLLIFISKYFLPTHFSFFALMNVCSRCCDFVTIARIKNCASAFRESRRKVKKIRHLPLVKNILHNNVTSKKSHTSSFECEHETRSLFFERNVFAE